MKLGIMQPYFFPYIGYWQLMNAVDKYVIYDDVNYINRSWITRNRILMEDEAKMINLKSCGASQNKLINEVKIPNDEKHKKKLLRTIDHCYKKSPNYKDIYKMLEEVIMFEEESLSIYLENSIRKIAHYLQIDTEIILSSNIEKNNKLRGQDKIIDICKTLNATEYYNALGGKELYSKEVFDSYNIKLQFIVPDLIKYRQFNNNFVPNLSIIDVMMFNNKEHIRDFLNSYTV